MFVRKLHLAGSNRLARLLVRLRSYRLLSWWMSCGVREWCADGTTRTFKNGPGQEPRPTVLVLQADRILADMRVLAEGGEIRVLDLNEPWLARIVFSFFPDGLGWVPYVAAQPKAPVKQLRPLLRKFLLAFLPHFYRRVPVDCVVRTDVKLGTDYDWCAVSEQLGVRYVLLQRENLIGQPPGFVAWQIERDRAIGRFEGSHLITYNHCSRDRYVKVGVADPEQTSVLGCLRMDRLIRSAREEKLRNRQNRITVFPIAFGRASNDTTRRVFDDVYGVIGQFALDHPDISVVIKIKKQWAKGNPDIAIGQSLKENGIDPSQLSNLHFTAEGDAQDFIFASDVVVGLNSTTILEAAVAGRPVIAPAFDVLRTDDIWPQIKFADDLDIFDVPRDAAEFGEMLERRMANPHGRCEVDQTALGGFREKFLLPRWQGA